MIFFKNMLRCLQMKTKRWSNEDFGLNAGEGQDDPGAQGAQGALVEDVGQDGQVVAQGGDAQEGVNDTVVKDPEGRDLTGVDSTWIICRLGWI